MFPFHIATFMRFLENMKDLEQYPTIPGALGIDVSRHQGKINWKKAYDDLSRREPGKPRVFVKATEGRGYVDPMFRENVEAAGAAGFSVGAYHFARIDSGQDPVKDAIAEAGDFLNTTEGVYLSEGLALDVELGGIKKRNPEYCRTWWEAATREIGHPAQYTGYWTVRWVFGKSQLTRLPSWLTDCPLWWAEYTNGPAPRRELPGWPVWMWQYSAKGHVDGIEGNVDMNKVLGVSNVA